MKFPGTTALVTGASSGIGAEFARAIAARGAGLVLVARRQDRLDTLAAELREQHGVPVTTIAADLGRPAPGESLRAELADRGLRVSLLVNNAGLGAAGSFSATAPELAQQVIAVNISALTDVTRALLPDMIAAGRGSVVNVASLLGHVPVPTQAVYAATKAYVLSFTDSLAYELRGTGVHALSLSPGSTRSEFYASSGTSESGVRFETPQQVVATALRALDAQRPPTRVVSGRTNRLNLALLHRLPRRLQAAVMASSVKPA